MFVGASGRPGKIRSLLVGLLGSSYPFYELQGNGVPLVLIGSKQVSEKAVKELISRHPK